MQTEQQTPKVKKTSSTASAVKKEKKVKDVLDNSSSEQPVTTNLEQKVEVVQNNESVKTENIVVEGNTNVVVQENTSVVVQELEINSTIDLISNFADKITEMSKIFKDTVLSKDERSKVEASFKKMNKAFTLIQSSYTDNLNKQLALLEKHNSGKSTGTKKVTDKEKSAIHKKLHVQDFLLKFMNLPKDTLVSRSSALSAITGYVKNEKVKNPDIIVSNDKRSFKLIGELKPLFDGIEKIMKEKGLLETKTMPTELRYTQIMEYMTHCFIKVEEPTA